MTLPRALVAPEPLTTFAENFYLGYPHTNCFSADGRLMVVGRLEHERVSLWTLDLTTGEKTSLCAFPRAAQLENQIWFDLSRDTGALALVADGRLYLANIHAPSRLETLFVAPEGAVMNTLPAITRSGDRLLVSFRRYGHTTLLGLTPDARPPRELARYPWYASHFHFCPHDENWIGLCHEGPTETIPDRVWARHDDLLPASRCLFDQHFNDPAAALCAGHERWTFHDTSVLIVAYGVSPGRPRGIYRAFPDGRPSRLVSPGDRDFHVNSSEDGRWIVVDTTGPHDLPGRGWENAQGLSDILLIDPHTGSRHLLAHTRTALHPSHPHPVFSPDGQWIYYNESHPSALTNRLLRIRNPFFPPAPSAEN